MGRGILTVVAVQNSLLQTNWMTRELNNQISTFAGYFPLGTAEAAGTKRKN